MTEEAKAARRAYMKKWREKNPDKVKAANVQYWEKKAQKYNQSGQKRSSES